MLPDATGTCLLRNKVVFWDKVDCSPCTGSNKLSLQINPVYSLNNIHIYIYTLAGFPTDLWDPGSPPTSRNEAPSLSNSNALERSCILPNKQVSLWHLCECNKLGASLRTIHVRFCVVFNNPDSFPSQLIVFFVLVLLIQIHLYLWDFLFCGSTWPFVRQDFLCPIFLDASLHTRAGGPGGHSRHSRHSRHSSVETKLTPTVLPQWASLVRKEFGPELFPETASTLYFPADSSFPSTPLPHQSLSWSEFITA